MLSGRVSGSVPEPTLGRATRRTTDLAPQCMTKSILCGRQGSTHDSLQHDTNHSTSHSLRPLCASLERRLHTRAHPQRATSPNALRIRHPRPSLRHLGAPPPRRNQWLHATAPGVFSTSRASPPERTHRAPPAFLNVSRRAPQACAPRPSVAPSSSYLRSGASAGDLAPTNRSRDRVFGALLLSPPRRLRAPQQPTAAHLNRFLLFPTPPASFAHLRRLEPFGPALIRLPDSQRSGVCSTRLREVLEELGASCLPLLLGAEVSAQLGKPYLPRIGPSHLIAHPTLSVVDDHFLLEPTPCLPTSHTRFPLPSLLRRPE